EEAQEQVLDSNELERERGITILAKNTSVPYKNLTINIVDTPGHADFGSEVERILTMVDGALLLVDAAEGPMPQTRFVLRKALAMGLKPIVVINKMDRPGAKPHDSLNKVFDLFVELGATDAQLDFPVVYAAGRQGWASASDSKPGTDLTPLFEMILKHVPPPAADPAKPLQMLITMLDFSSYTGQIAIGRIANGSMTKGQPAALIRAGGQVATARITKIEKYFGLKRREVQEATAGDIVAVSGFEQINIGETVCTSENPEALAPVAIDEPTLSMEFTVNNSPFAGKDGKFVTARHLNERLSKEQKTNVGLKIEPLAGEGRFKVSGRGELHLSVLIETMRREGYEFSVSRPQVIYKEEGGKTLEPVEHLVLDVPAEYQGAAIESLGRRASKMINMAQEGEKRVRLEYLIPVRGLMGFKSEMLTLTKGLGMMHHSFDGYAPRESDIAARAQGVMIAKEQGRTTGYALSNLQERGTLLVGPGVDVYEGMVIGMSARGEDMVVNPCKAKAMSNMRSKASDDAIMLTPPLLLSLEQALEFIDDSELVEVTPLNIRLRKKVLSESFRRRTDRD
ncbi:MAG: translational GTPase TypA, partial [Elusimicrobia bacterium]|nr:translational GTPase TypA [Elusimicrobiota bacterium]